MFGTGYLIYWGIHYSWVSAGLLFIFGSVGTTLLVNLEGIILPSEKAIKMVIISMVGMITLPFIGYLLFLQA